MRGFLFTFTALTIKCNMMEDNLIDFILPKLNLVDHTLFDSIIKECISVFELDKRLGKKTVDDAIYMAGKFGLIDFSGNARVSGKLTVNGYYVVKEGGYLKYLSKNRERDNVRSYNFYGNIGQVIQDSRFSNSQAINNEKATPNINEPKSILIRFWELISNNKLVSTLIASIIGYLAVKYFT